MNKCSVRYTSEVLNCLAVISGLTLAVLVGGCETTKQVGQQLGAAVPSVTSPASAGDTETTSAAEYHGPRARLTALRFTDATGGQWQYTESIGEGMRRKLVSSLVETGRFRVLDRRSMQDRMTEIELGRSGLVDPKTAAELGRMAGARLVVTAAVTDFDEKISGSSPSRQKAGGIWGALSSVVSNTNQAYIAVNLEAIDVETSEVVASKQVEGKVTDVNITGALGAQTGLGDVGSWDQYPRGKALQKVVDKAV